MQKRFGEPIEYVRGFTDFLGCKIDLSKRPLIPRPETEFWTEKAVKNILTFYRILECYKDKKIKVLDTFAGSGCIGVAVLRHVKNAKVVFADNDPKCLTQIKINLKLNKSLIRANKGRVVRSDVFSSINKKEKFDFVFANPPYVAEKNKNLVQKSVLDYEPRNALFAGQDGLFYIRKFLRGAKKHLNPGGRIFMEFSPEQKKQIETLLKKYKYKNWEFRKDQFGRWRWLACR